MPTEIIDINLTLDLAALRDPEQGENEAANAVYKVLVKLFEAGGEHNRYEDGSPLLACHGHHRAQKVTEMVMQEWLQARDRARALRAAAEAAREAASKSPAS